MKKTPSAKRKSPAAESIARMADEGKDVSRFFTNSGRMVPPVQRVNVDFTAPMLEELDRQAQELNISRQAVIKTLLRRGLINITHRRPAGNQIAIARLGAIDGDAACRKTYGDEVA
jgi:hypothetical protein